MCPHQLDQGRGQSQEGQDLLARLKSARRDLWNWLLDTSVFFSFDASGLNRHRREIERREQRWGAFSDQLSASDHFVVTGANSGLGFALADQLLARGATVSLICRSASRGCNGLPAVRFPYGLPAVRSPCPSRTRRTSRRLKRALR